MPFDGHSSSGNSNKPVTKHSNASKLVVKKPYTLNTCPINTVREPLPEIEEKCVKKLPRKNKNSCSNSSTEWLKPGVSLPKLRTRDVFSKRPDAGEPYNVAPKSLRNANVIDYAWVSTHSPSSLALNCSQFEEDAIEDVKVDNQDTVGPSKCQFVINVPSSELVFDDIEILEEFHEPSHALQLWEIWMKKRKHMQDVACKKLNRKPYDLVINQSETYRKILEDKIMFSYAQLPEADKRRSHGQNDKSKKKHKLHDLFRVESRRKKCVIPDIEFVDIPRVIDIEKGYISEGENKVKSKMMVFWEESPYRRERSQFFKRQRSRLKPNEIHVDELAVVGKQIRPTQIENFELGSSTDLPTIHVDDPNEDAFSEDRKTIACLVIDGIEIKRELVTDYSNSDVIEDERDYTWQIEFGLNKVKTFVERTITVENKGTTAIAYSWAPRKLTETLSLSAIKQGTREPWFFFNKNSGIFLPGQIHHLKFYHHARRAGNQTEIWFLKTYPELFATPESCRFIMTAVAEDDRPENEVHSLQRYLNRRVGESFVKNLLNEIIYNVTHSCLGFDYIEYRCYFSEKQLFEFHNSKRYYHSSIVAELKYLFDQAARLSQKEWDLSLSTLLNVIMENTSGEHRKYLLSTLTNFSKQLFRPIYLAQKKDKKHRMAYQILCKMTSFMEKDYWQLRKCLARNRKERKGKCRHEDFGECTYEEYGEVENATLKCPYYTNAISLSYFQTMFYIKVYQHMCDAVQNIADIVETNTLLEPMKTNRVNDFECSQVNEIL